MENKFKIIETTDYILAVFYEEIKEGESGLFYDFDYNKITKKARDVNGNKYFSRRNIKKIIAYQPKGNASELNLPLLPEMVVEDGVEKLACNIYNLSYEEYLHIREHVSQTRECIEVEYEHLGLEIPNKYFDVISFIAGHNHKSSTKVYSEDDLRKAIELSRITYKEKTFGTVLPKYKPGEIINLVTQPKPLWFVAETEKISNMDSKPVKIHKNIEPIVMPNSFSLQLKTTTINGRTYLVGKYLNE